MQLDNWTDFLWGNKISELYIKNNVRIMFMSTDKSICMSAELDVSL